MKRREFNVLAATMAATWPFAARTQQSAMPVIGFLEPTSFDKYAPFVGRSARAFARSGSLRVTMWQLNIVGRKVSTRGYRDWPLTWCNIRWLSLLRRIKAARAAKAATSTIPIVFNTGGDPAKFDLITSFSKPGQNVTGVASLGKELVAKQLEVLHELIPRADSIAFLVNPNNALAGLDTRDAQAAAETLGKKLVVVEAGTKDELDKAFTAIFEQHGGALVVQADPFFLGQRDQIVALAAHHTVPAIYYLKDYPAAGGLVSYGTSLADALRLVGNYTGRILKGEKPGDLPIQQSVRTEFVINLKSARALGLTVPHGLLNAADEVIE